MPRHNSNNALRQCTDRRRIKQLISRSPSSLRNSYRGRGKQRADKCDGEPQVSEMYQHLEQQRRDRRLQAFVHCAMCRWVGMLRELLAHQGELHCPRCESNSVSWVEHPGTDTIH